MADVASSTRTLPAMREIGTPMISANQKENHASGNVAPSPSCAPPPSSKLVNVRLSELARKAMPTIQIGVYRAIRRAARS